MLPIRTRWLYHPVTIFLSIQVLWILLMIVWIRWYVEKHAQVREMAQQLRAQVVLEGWWVPLVEGGILLTLILAGATLIFIYWNKQHRLNQMQRTFVSNVTHELKSPVASIQLAHVASDKMKRPAHCASARISLGVARPTAARAASGGAGHW